MATTTTPKKQQEKKTPRTAKDEAQQVTFTESSSETKRARDVQKGRPRLPGQRRRGARAGDASPRD